MTFGGLWCHTPVVIDASAPLAAWDHGLPAPLRDRGRSFPSGAGGEPDGHGGASAGGPRTASPSGLATDPAWAHRQMLPTVGSRLSKRHHVCLMTVLATPRSDQRDRRRVGLQRAPAPTPGGPRSLGYPGPVLAVPQRLRRGLPARGHPACHDHRHSVAAHHDAPEVERDQRSN